MTHWPRSLSRAVAEYVAKKIRRRRHIGMCGSNSDRFPVQILQTLPLKGDVTNPFSRCRCQTYCIVNKRSEYGDRRWSVSWSNSDISTVHILHTSAERWHHESESTEYIVNKRTTFEMNLEGTATYRMVLHLLHTSLNGDVMKSGALGLFKYWGRI